jgi:hypothetical protein
MSVPQVYLTVTLESCGEFARTQGVLGPPDGSLSLAVLSDDGRSVLATVKVDVNAVVEHGAGVVRVFPANRGEVDG